jgi:hypothetical protein
MKDGWLKSFQSVGRGLRPSTSHHIVSGTGKTWMDIEGDAFKSTHPRPLSRPHWAQFTNHSNGTTYWKSYRRRPNSSDMFIADRVIEQYGDGAYRYIKDRTHNRLARPDVEISRDDMAQIILQARNGD